MSGAPASFPIVTTLSLIITIKTTTEGSGAGWVTHRERAEVQHLVKLLKQLPVLSSSWLSSDTEPAWSCPYS